MLLIYFLILSNFLVKSEKFKAPWLVLIRTCESGRGCNVFHIRECTEVGMRRSKPTPHQETKIDERNECFDPYHCGKLDDRKPMPGCDCSADCENTKLTTELDGNYQDRGLIHDTWHNLRNVTKEHKKKRENEYRGPCTGVIITERLVLTSAFCIRNISSFTGEPDSPKLKVITFKKMFTVFLLYSIPITQSI